MAQTLLTAGYSSDTMKVLSGGWTAWQTAGYPTETSPMPAGAIPVPGQPGAPGAPAIVVSTVAPPSGTPTP